MDRICRVLVLLDGGVELDPDQGDMYQRLFGQAPVGGVMLASESDEHLNQPMFQQVIKSTQLALASSCGVLNTMALNQALKRRKAGHRRLRKMTFMLKVRAALRRAAQRARVSIASRVSLEAPAAPLPASTESPLPSPRASPRLSQVSQREGELALQVSIQVPQELATYLTSNGILDIEGACCELVLDQDADLALLKETLFREYALPLYWQRCFTFAGKVLEDRPLKDQGISPSFVTLEFMKPHLIELAAERCEGLPFDLPKFESVSILSEQEGRQPESSFCAACMSGVQKLAACGDEAPMKIAVRLPTEERLTLEQEKSSMVTLQLSSFAPLTSEMRAFAGELDTFAFVYPSDKAPRLQGAVAALAEWGGFAYRDKNGRLARVDALRPSARGTLQADGERLGRDPICEENPLLATAFPAVARPMVAIGVRRMVWVHSGQLAALRPVYIPQSDAADTLTHDLEAALKGQGLLLLYDDSVREDEAQSENQNNRYHVGNAFFALPNPLA